MRKWYVPSGLAAAVTFFAIFVLVNSAQAAEIAVSGQISQLVMWADNGIDDDWFIGDNTNSSSRFRFTGSQEFGATTVGFNFEMEAVRNGSVLFDIPSEDDGEFVFNDRKIEANFDGFWGRISLGKGDGAANNTSEVDLSGTTVAQYSGVNDTAGGFTWKVKGTPSPGVDFRGDLKVIDTRSSFDGLGRNDRILYVTPRFAGFRFFGSITNGSAWELATRYVREFGGHKLAGGLGYVNSQNRTDPRFYQWGGSISWLAPFGLSLTVAAGQRDPQAADSFKAKNYYGKVGYQFLDIHAVSFEYGMTEDLDAKGDESSNYGLAYVITPWKGVELYAAGRVFQLKTTAEPIDPEDIRQLYAGTRIKF